MMNTRYDFPSLVEEFEKFAQREMRQTVKKIDWQGLKVESTVQVGHAGQQICGRAQHQHADLIVIATHGRTGLEHLFLGSTAEFVVRHAHCPVLVVPARSATTTP